MKNSCCARFQFSEHQSVLGVFSRDKHLLPTPSDTDIGPLPPTSFTYEAPPVPGIFETPVYFGETDYYGNLYRLHPQDYPMFRVFADEPVSSVPIGGPGVPGKQNYVPPEPDTWVSYAYIQSQRGNGNQQATPEYQARQTPAQQQLDQACAKLNNSKFLNQECHSCFMINSKKMPRLPNKLAAFSRISFVEATKHQHNIHFNLET